MTPEEILRNAGLGDPQAELLTFLRRQRWFSGRERDLQRIEIVDAGAEGDDPLLVPVLVDAVYGDGGRERYSIPLSVRPAGRGIETDVGLVAMGTREGAPVEVVDALIDPEAAVRFWDLISANGEIATAVGRLRGQTEPGAAAAPPDAVSDGAAGIHPLGRDQSNSSLVRDEQELLKFFRKIEQSSSPELEMLQALHHAGFTGIAAPMGRVAYRQGEGEEALLALLQPYLHNATDGFQLAMTSLRDLYSVAEGATDSDALAIRQAIDEQGSDFTPEANRMGAIVGEMHLTLASDRMPEDMRAVPATGEMTRAWAEEMEADLERLFANADRTEGLDRDRLQAAIGALKEVQDGGQAVRYHGDLHLGQMVRTDAGWIVLDFEGEPSRSVELRRRRSSPLRDVAGVLRSFSYAAAVALMERATPDDPDWERLLAYGDAWAEVNRDAFWDAYVGAVGGGDLLPDAGVVAAVLRAFEVQKAIYELGYELGHRPDLAWIARRALGQL
jgi:trehalose synthase-fused probable maltokinase